MERIRQSRVNAQTSYEEHLGKEIEDQRRLFFVNALAYYGHLCAEPRRDLLAFATAPVFSTIPIVSIYSRMWSSLFTRCRTRAITTSDATDIDVLSTYLPYMDVVATDAFMAEQLRSLGVDKEYDVRVYHAKTPSLTAFIAFLEEYLRTHEPVNRPRFSIFVLPAERIKQDAWEFYRHLCNSVRAIQEPDWVDVYGFDDGNMPRYGGGTKWAPFFGLQDVAPIPLQGVATQNDILELCRKHCLSDKFLIIHDHIQASRDFVTQAVHNAEAGKNQYLNFGIYNKEA